MSCTHACATCWQSAPLGEPIRHAEQCPHWTDPYPWKDTEGDGWTLQARGKTVTCGVYNPLAEPLSPDLGTTEGERNG